MDVMIAGGGTGGHLFPGIAVAQELRRRDPQGKILFVGTPRGIETRAVPKAGFDLELLSVSGLRRTGLKGLVLGLIRLPLAMVQAIQLVRRFNPHVAVSVGGYAAGPAVLASRLLGVPCIVMEQNAVPGFTNKILGRLARFVLAGLPTHGFPREKVKVLGNPVRADFLPIRQQSYEPHAPRHLLVFGGSQGARALNEVMMELAPRLAAETLVADGLKIVHQTGAVDFDRVRAAYDAAGLTDVHVTPFIDAMSDAYAEADIVLSRAGAMTLAELTVCGRPSILVPYPYAVDDHQTANARTLEQAGAAVHLPQAELTPTRLWEVLGNLLADQRGLTAMARAAHGVGKPQAAASIVTVLDATAYGQPFPRELSDV